MVPKSDLGAFWSDFSEFRMQNHSVLKTFCQICKRLNASVVSNCVEPYTLCILCISSLLWLGCGVSSWSKYTSFTNIFCIGRAEALSIDVGLGGGIRKIR